MYADHLSFEEHLARGYQLGDYALLERIGRGGEGTVWSAWNEQHKRVVALKVVLTLGTDPFYSPMISSDFENQVHLLETLEHPNILPFYEFGVSDDYSYFATRYNCCGSLADLLRAGPVSLQETFDLIGQISAALEYLHLHKVVHRDLKPSNILLDSQRRAYLSDFGLAKRLLQDTAPLHTGRGTSYYAPFEQHIPGVITPQSDIYSLGILIYEMLTGKLPWEGTNDLLKQQSQGKLILPDLQDTNPELPSALSEVLRYMTAFEWIKRPISVSAARDLMMKALPEPLRSDTASLHRPMPVLDECRLIAQDARYLLGRYLPNWDSETEAFPASLTHLALFDSVLMQDEPHTIALDDELGHFMRRGALAHGYRLDYWWENVSDRRAKKRTWEQAVAIEDDAIIDRTMAQLTQSAQTDSFLGRPSFSSLLGRAVLFVMGLTLIFVVLGNEGFRQIQASNEQDLAATNLELEQAQANLTAAQRELAAARAAVEASQEKSDEEAAEAERQLQLNLAKVAAAEEALAAAQAIANNSQQGLMFSAIFDDESMPVPTNIILSKTSIAENRPAGTIVGFLSTVTGEDARGTNNDVISSTPSRDGTTASEQIGNSFTYSLVADTLDNNAFIIEGNMLKTAISFDFETRERYIIRVKSDNGEGGIFEKGLIIVVTDEDDVPRIGLEDVVVSEEKGVVSVTVIMTGASDSNVMTRYITSDGTATRGQDYIVTNGALRWAAGETGARSFVVPIVDDDINEREESFNITLFGSENAIIEREKAIVTITNDDGPATLDVADVTVAEDAGEATVSVVLTGVNNTSVKVRYTTADGSAIADLDYTAVSGTLTWERGESGARSFVVPILEDGTHESDEVFTISITDRSSKSGFDSTATVTISDDDLAPVLSMAEFSVVQDVVDRFAVVTVIMAGESGLDVLVDYATSDKTAVAGRDYQATSGTLTWAAGESGAKTFEVPILGDELDEADEDFVVTISNPVNATIAKGMTTITITDDDDAPSLTINDVTIDESDGTATVVVELNGKSSQGVAVDFATTSGGTATAGKDYIQLLSPIPLSWEAEETGSKTFKVTVTDDAIFELHETIHVTLFNPMNAAIADASAVVRINDDDPLPSIVVSDLTVNERERVATVSVVMTGGSGLGASVKYDTSDDTAAIANSDYVPATGTLTWNVDETDATKTFDVQIANDRVHEPGGEVFNVRLSSPRNATIVRGTATVTIADDDNLPTLSFGANMAANEGVGSIRVTVRLNGASSSGVTVGYSTNNTGSAAAGSDYTGKSGTLTWAPNEADTTRSITLFITNDNFDEINESFNISLSGPSGAAILDGVIVVTIVDDDTAGVTITESGSGTSVAENGATDSYTVRLDTIPTAPVNITLSPDSQTDLGSGAGVAKTLSFAADASALNAQTITVVAFDDAIDEPSPHTSTIGHSASSADPGYNGAAASFSPSATVAVSITDDDTAGVTITESGSGTNVAEGGATDSYTIRLDTIPTAPVDITLSPDSQTDLGNGAGMAKTLSFAADASALNAQTVTVTAFDDAIDEPSPHTSTIGHSASSADPIYNGGAASFSPSATVTVSITDDDTAGVTITETGNGTNVTEGGATDSYTIQLDTVPTAPVNINLFPGPQTDVGNGAGMARTISFAADASALNVQTVTVTAFDDAIDEPSPHTGTISHSASSADPDYNGAAASFSPSANLTVNVTDNDPTPSLAVTDVSVVEGDSGAVQVTVTVTMTGTSSRNVSVDYLTVDGTASHFSNDYARINPAQTLSWTPGQTGPILFSVTVNGDNVDEGASEEFFINFSNVTNATMSDTQTTVTIVDDDTAAVIIDQSGGSTDVAEGGVTDAYSIRLDTVPATGVNITVMLDSQIDVGSGAGVTLTLTFAPDATALVGQTVTVIAVDDLTIEASPHTSVIVHSANSSDPLYNGANVTFSPSANVAVSITDND